MITSTESKGNIRIEITDATEFHCFRMVFNPRSAPGQSENEFFGTGYPQEIEIMLHAAALVDLINQCSLALCEWQRDTTSMLIQRMTGLNEEEARQKGLIA